jgi:hypothetical protein
VLSGATAVIFAVGLGSSLRHVVSGLSLTSTEQVRIQVGSGGSVVVVNGRARAIEPVPEALAVAGALLPAGWAAGSTAASALHAE